MRRGVAARMHFSENPNLYRKSRRLFKDYWNLRRDNQPVLPKNFSRKGAKDAKKNAKEERENGFSSFASLRLCARNSFSSMKVVRGRRGDRKGEWLYMPCFDRNNVILVLQPSFD